MTIIEKIGDEKLQYNINREAAKISALTSRKNHKYEHVMDEEILPAQSSQIYKLSSTKSLAKTSKNN